MEGNYEILNRIDARRHQHFGMGELHHALVLLQWQIRHLHYLLLWWKLQYQLFLVYGAKAISVAATPLG